MFVFGNFTKGCHHGGKHRGNLDSRGAQANCLNVNVDLLTVLKIQESRDSLVGIR